MEASSDFELHQILDGLDGRPCIRRLSYEVPCPFEIARCLPVISIHISPVSCSRTHSFAIVSLLELHLLRVLRDRTYFGFCMRPQLFQLLCAIAPIFDLHAIAPL
jgi:hypothetical protein